MSIPQNGTYVPENKTMQIEIISADASKSTIEATYQHNFPPVDAEINPPVNVIHITGEIGKFYWVENNDGGSGTAPFSINFTASIRPDGWPYCLVDFWNGYYSTENTIVLTGTRSYVKNDGTAISVGLGTLTLYLVP